MLPPDIPRCQHIKVNGIQCGSPALHGHDYCYFHHNARKQLRRRPRKPWQLTTGDWPLLLEDANSIQMALIDVIRAIADGSLDSKRAGLILYALQTAVINLRGTHFEPSWRDVVVGFEDDASEAAAAAANVDPSGSPTAESRQPTAAFPGAPGDPPPADDRQPTTILPTIHAVASDLGVHGAPGVLGDPPPAHDRRPTTERFGAPGVAPTAESRWPTATSGCFASAPVGVIVFTVMSFERASGILLHPTSLPSRGGIGDLGPAAYRFLDFLAAARQTLWQLLPLGPAGYGNSPYSATSAFAGNPLLISPERLVERGWIEPRNLHALPDSVLPVDYQSVRAAKLPLLREAARNFLRQRRECEYARFQRFVHENAWWLEDFVLFEVLRERHQFASWNCWPLALARREPAVLERTRSELAEELNLARVLQFFFLEQWRALHRRCAELGIRVIGDVAIFVSYDSADVWVNPDIFYLNDDLAPSVVAGVPPDHFSAAGQRWGNPLYRWDVLKARGYDWWVRRLRWALETCDILRLDHFLGFERYWEIPASQQDAIQGRWVAGPKDDLFHAVRREAGELPFIAEDLGLVTPEARALRQRLNIPGMRVLQFGFNDPGAHIYLPHQYERNSVVYTGTHDNPTTAGWWTSCDEQRRCQVLAYVGDDREGIHWAFIRAAQASVADLCVVPLQDVLGLDNSARMNVPSQPDGNWTWRFPPDALTPGLAAKLAALAEVCDRGGPHSAADQKRHWEMGEDFAA